MLKINKPPGGLDREFTVDGSIEPKIRKKSVRELFYSQNANRPFTPFIHKKSPGNGGIRIKFHVAS